MQHVSHFALRNALRRYVRAGLALSTVLCFNGCGEAHQAVGVGPEEDAGVEQRPMDQPATVLTQSAVAARLDALVATCATGLATGNPVIADESIAAFASGLKSIEDDVRGARVRLRFVVDRIDREGAFVRTAPVPISEAYDVTRFIAGKPWNPDELRSIVIAVLHTGALNALFTEAEPSRAAGWLQRGTEIPESTFRRLHVGQVLERAFIIDGVHPCVGTERLDPELFAGLIGLDFGDPSVNGNRLLETARDTGVRLLVTGAWAPATPGSLDPATPRTAADSIDHSRPTSDRTVARIEALGAALEQVTATLAGVAGDRAPSHTSAGEASRLHAQYNDLKPYEWYDNPGRFLKAADGMTPPSGWTTLHAAALQDDGDLIRAASRHLFSPARPGPRGITPLHVAALGASEASMKLLLPDRFLEDATAAARQYVLDLGSPDAGGLAAVRGRRYWAEYAKPEGHGSFDGRAAWLRAARSVAAVQPAALEPNALRAVDALEARGWPREQVEQALRELAEWDRFSDEIMAVAAGRDPGRRNELHPRHARLLRGQPATGIDRARWDVVDDHGLTPLDYALIVDNIEAARALRAAGMRSTIVVSDLEHPRLRPAASALSEQLVAATESRNHP